MESNNLYDEMKLHSVGIERLGLSPYAFSCLHMRGYGTVGALAKLSVQELKQIGGIGESYSAEIIEKLSDFGIELRDDNAGKEHKSKENVRALPYPHNLIAAVRGLKPDEVEPEDISSDRQKGIAIALSLLSEKEETMLILRYRHNATLKEIGNYYGVTMERARQIIKGGLKRLNHPTRWILVEKGLNAYIKDRIDAEVSKKVEQALSEEYKRGYNDALAVINSGDDPHAAAVDKIKDTPLIDAKFTTRTYNVLRRAGLNTIGDILNRNNVEQIMSINHMTTRTGLEIVNKLHEYGFTDTAWNYFLSIPGVVLT